MTDVSVALATYNGAEHLPKQLNSILDQTRPVDEIVVCDDGSTDGTRDLLKLIERSADPDVNVFLNGETLGPYRNFEWAIQNCTGDIILVCDQDDVWKDEKVERQVEKLEETGADVAFHNSAIIDDSGNRVTDQWSAYNYDPGLASDELAFLYRLVKGNPINGMSMAVRREFANRVLPLPELWAHDYFILLAGLLFGDVVEVDEELALYRSHGDQHTGQPKELLTTKVLKGRGGLGGEDYSTQSDKWTNFKRWVMDEYDGDDWSINRREAMDRIGGVSNYHWRRGKLQNGEFGGLLAAHNLAHLYFDGKYSAFSDSRPEFLAAKDLIEYCVARLKGTRDLSGTFDESRKDSI